MRILVTNDDGIYAPGLHVLVSHLRQAGHVPVVVAPPSDRSGCGAAVGSIEVGNLARLVSVQLDGLPDVEAYALDAYPALAVLAGCQGVFGPIDVVVSGINPGWNIGRSAIHSGTMGAALTAAHLGVPALAVSIEWAEAPEYPTAARLAITCLNEIEAMARSGPAHFGLINLNTPDLPIDELAGLRLASLGASTSLCTELRLGSAAEPGAKGIEVSIGVRSPTPDPDGDLTLLLEGYATITPIVGLGEAVSGGAFGAATALLARLAEGAVA